MRLVGQDAKHRLRQKKREYKEQRCDPKRDLHGDRGGFFDIVKVLFAPEARRDHNDAVRNTADEHLQEKLDLVDQRDAGQCQLRITAEHNVVEQAHAVHDHVLQRDDDEHPEKRTPELSIRLHMSYL